VRFAQRIGKLPVLVKDSPGFLVNRILVPYLIEAGVMFWNGAEVKDIDAAMLDFGMPMGPLRLIDEIGADIALEVATTLTAAFPNRLHVPDVLPALQGTMTIGRKMGRGFYKYHKGTDASPNKEIVKLRPPGSTRAPGRDEIEQRLALLMINEAARCLEERIVGSPSEVDLAMVMGTGFPPFRGGPLRYADSLAIARVFNDLSRFTESAGPIYTPCNLIRDMAKSGKRFYED
jgi:3-hydroxyacyl-CoA dehydrogenase / enoyl-CoA hydratase / 3-hydroxybutyryl-CoA epimerase